jgi:hypothetical protein
MLPIIQDMATDEFHITPPMGFADWNMVVLDLQHVRNFQAVGLQRACRKARIHMTPRDISMLAIFVVLTEAGMSR